MATQLLRLHDVISRTGLGRSTIYRRLAEGSFPRPVGLGVRAIAWRETEINEWIDSLAAKSLPDRTA